MKKYLIFIIACVAACLLPFIGMAVRPTTVSTENKAMSGFPSLKSEDGSLNLDFFQEFETYFQEHFAFRNELVYADAKIQTSIFQVSNVDAVTYGTEGWLYYSSTLDDYLGSNVMSERQIYNLAHNLSLAKQYVEEKGRDFLLAIPPIKIHCMGSICHITIPILWIIRTMWICWGQNCRNWEFLMPICQSCFGMRMRFCI